MAIPTEIQREMLEAWNRRDWQAMGSLFHADYTYTGADGEELVGPDAGLAVARSYADAFPDGKLEITNAHVEGNTGVTEFVLRATHGGNLLGVPATGKPIEVAVCNVVEIRDGKISREREYVDMLSVMMQIGAVTLPRAKGQSA